MYGQITNREGEKLYILTVVYTKDINPYITVNTWEKCKEKLEYMTTGKDSSRLLTQLTYKKINEELGIAKVSIRRNKRGWGCDYFIYITIKPLYTEAW